MPVVSKTVVPKKRPLVLGPRPYRKHTEAWSLNGDSADKGIGELNVNGDSHGPTASPTRPKGSILKSPTTETPIPSTRPSVTFSNESNGRGDSCEHLRFRLRKLNKTQLQIRENKNTYCEEPGSNEGDISAELMNGHRHDTQSVVSPDMKALRLVETVEECEVRR